MAFARFDPKATDFITPEEQEANFRAANFKKRASRPHQKPPTVRGQGQKRKHVQHDTQPFDDEQLVADEDPSTDRNSSKWGERQLKKEKAWSEQREDNSQSAVQYQTLLSDGVELLQLAAAEQCALEALCKAVLLHPCLMVVLEADGQAAAQDSLLAQLMAFLPDERARPAAQDGQQQQQQQAPPASQQPASQQQQQQQQAAPILQVVAARLVACHTLGASFWLPVPTMRCNCCSIEWEQQPAAAGFFGSSPVQPWAWFSQQLLNFYTPLCTSAGCSITNMAAALDRGNIRAVDDARLEVDAR